MEAYFFDLCARTTAAQLILLFWAPHGPHQHWGLKDDGGLARLNVFGHRA
jgi:hypothetical protein